LKNELPQVSVFILCLFHLNRSLFFPILIFPLLLGKRENFLDPRVRGLISLGDRVGYGSTHNQREKKNIETKTLLLSSHPDDEEIGLVSTDPATSSWRPPAEQWRYQNATRSETLCSWQVNINLAISAPLYSDSERLYFQNKY
jgi:hypothetical protein